MGGCLAWNLIWQTGKHLCYLEHYGELIISCISEISQVCLKGTSLLVFCTDLQQSSWCFIEGFLTRCRVPISPERVCSAALLERAGSSLFLFIPAAPVTEQLDWQWQCHVFKWHPWLWSRDGCWDVPCAGQGSEGAESAALVLVLLFQGVLWPCPVNASAVAAMLQDSSSTAAPVTAGGNGFLLFRDKQVAFINLGETKPCNVFLC